MADSQHASSTSNDGEAPATAGGAVLGKRTRSVTPPAASTNGHAAAASTSIANEDDSSDDDDVGPMPMPEGGDDNEAGPSSATATSTSTNTKAAAKRRKILKYERVYLDNMPSADRYYSELKRSRSCICSFASNLCGHRIFHA